MLPRQLSSLLVASALAISPVVVYSAGNILVQAPRPLLDMTNKGVVTIPFTVENKSSLPQVFEETIELPPGWRLLTTSFPFTLLAGQRDTRLVHLYAPSDVQPGKIPLRYTVVARTDRSLRESTRVQVRVKSISSAGLEILEAPGKVIAGGRFEVKLNVRNTGNKTDSFRVSADDGQFAFITSRSPRRLKLKPGEEGIITIKGKVPTRLKDTTSYLLRIKLKASRSDLVLDKDVRIQLISRTPRGIGKYHTLTSHLSIRQLVNETTKTTDSESTITLADEDKKSSTTQLDFRGRGVLDDLAKHHVEFEFRAQQDGSGFDSNNNFGLNEKYRLDYWNQKLTLHAGDFSFNGNDLVGGGYGRGLGAEYRQDDYWLKAAWVKDISHVSSEGSANLSAGYLFKNGLEIGLQAQQKEKDGKNYNIAGIRADFNWSSLQISAEAASSEGGTGLLLDIGGGLGKASYDFRARQADTDFGGAIKDSQQLNASFNYPITDRLVGTLGSNYSKNNLDKDIENEIRQRDEKYLRLSYDLWDSRSGRLSLEEFRIDEKDLRTLSTKNQAETGHRLEYSHRFDDWNASIKHEQLTLEDKLTGETIPLDRNGLRLSYVPTDEDFQLGTFVDQIQTRSGDEQLNYGLNAQWRFSPRTNISAHWRKGLHDAEISSGSDFYELSASHEFYNGLQLSLKASRNLQADEDDNRTIETGWMLELGVPIDIPFRKRKSVGSLRGKVLQAGTDKPLADAIVGVKGMYAVSDKHGNFRFDDIASGDYELDIDMSHLNLNSYSTASGKPIKIKVEADKKHQVKVPMLRAASLSGVISMDIQAEGGSGESAIGKGGLLVTLSQIGAVKNTTGKTYKRLSMADGSFAFYGIPPGTWQVQVLDVDEKLDRERITSPVRTVNLHKGQDSTVNFKIVPETHNIIKAGPSGGLFVEGD